jgi:hypothetical protein
MKKTILLAIFLTGLATIVILFFFRKSHSYDFAINVTDTSEINEIIVSGNSGKLILQKQDYRWTVNEKFSANQQLIKQLFRLFAHLEIEILVERNLIDKMRGQLLDSGLHIQFRKKNKLHAEYWIGDFNPSTNATLMMNSTKTPAYVAASGISKNIRKYAETEDIFWRNRQIFSIKPGQIKEINLQNHHKTENSFTIIHTGNDFKLMDFKGKQVNFDKARIERYISYFSSIGFEKLAEEINQNQLDSIRKDKPLYSIHLKSMNNIENKLILFEKTDENSGEKPDLNLVYGNLNNDNYLVIISYFQIDPILKEISFFK